VCSLKSHRILTSSVSRTFSTLCSHQLLVVGMLYFLHRFQCSIVATLSCLSLYSVWAILLQALTRWSTVSSFALHSRHLLLSLVPSIRHLIAFVLSACP